MSKPDFVEKEGLRMSKNLEWDKNFTTPTEEKILVSYSDLCNLFDRVDKAWIIGCMSGGAMQPQIEMVIRHFMEEKTEKS